MFRNHFKYLKFASLALTKHHKHTTFLLKAHLHKDCKNTSAGEGCHIVSPDSLI